MYVYFNSIHVYAFNTELTVEWFMKLHINAVMMASKRCEDTGECVTASDTIKTAHAGRRGSVNFHLTYDGFWMFCTITGSYLTFMYARHIVVSCAYLDTGSNNGGGSYCSY